MDQALYSTNHTMLGFYEYVIMGGNHEMKMLKRMLEPQRRLLVMKNMSILLHDIPDEFDKLRSRMFQRAQDINFQLIFGGRGGRGRGGRGRGRGGRGRGRGGRGRGRGRNDHRNDHRGPKDPKELEHHFRRMLATANHLAHYAKKTYKDFPIVQTMASQLLEVANAYRAQLDHTFLFGGKQTKTLEEHYACALEGLDNEEKDEFSQMVGPSMSKLEYLMQTKVDCAQFEEGVYHMVKVLLDMDMQTEVQTRYAQLFLDVLSQVARTKYVNCLDKIQNNFYLLHEKIQSGI